MKKHKNIIKKSKADGKNRRFTRLRLIFVPIAAVIIVCVIFLSNILGNDARLTVHAEDLTKAVTPAKVDTLKISDSFINSSADFSINLFKKSMTDKKNSLISPVSVYLALSMTANGTDGNTLKEFESVLGKSNLTMNDINKYCYSFHNNLADVKTGKLNIANSIWYRQDNYLKVNKSFLQTNADYYNAYAYKADFNSKQTAQDINNWVKFNTGNLIDKIVDKIDSDTVMYLINTLYFENEWQDKYNKGDVRDKDFKLDDGTTISAKFMYSDESIYLKDDMAQGFIKPYKDDKYSFAAMLPNDGISVDDYAASLTGEKFLSLVKNKANAAVHAGLPKFKSEYSKGLVEPLKAMGLVDCFNPNSANFSKMGSLEKGNLFIGDVLHKTFIQVDELGTKAGAVTKVEMKTTSMPLEVKNVILDHPFVYAIIDNETNLPLFIGTMHNP